VKRKSSPLHDKWHKRVEGQVRHCIKCHPEYFNSNIPTDVIVNSLAKRIVGEIVADCTLATINPNA
jgi:hypothetical protein